MEQKIITIGTKEGLPNEQIHSVVLDKYERLWLSGPAGLSCYDGNTLRAFDSRDGLLCSGLRSLYATKEDEIWIGTDRGIEMMHIDGTYQPLALDFEWIYGIGNVFYYQKPFLWAGTSYGLLKLEYNNHSLSLVEAHDVGLIYKIIRFNEHKVMAVTAKRGVVVSTAEGVSDFETPIPENAMPLTIHKTFESNLLIGTSDGLFHVTEDGKIISEYKPTKGYQKVTSINTVGSDYAVAFYKSVVIVKVTSFEILELEFIEANSIVNFIQVDRFQNLWLGTNNAGLKKIPSLRKAIQQIDCGADDAVFTIRERGLQDEIYIGGTDYYSILTVKEDSYKLLDHFAVDAIVWDTIVDPKDDFVVWLATQDGLYKSVDSTEPVKDENLENIITGPGRILLTRGDELWVGTISGLYRVVDGIAEEIFINDEFSFGYVYILELNVDDKIWVGTLGQGLWLETDTGFKNICDENLAKDGNTYAITIYPKNGNVLVVQQENIVLLNQQLETKTVFRDYPIGGWTATWVDDSTVAVGSSDGFSLIDVYKGKLLNRINLYLDKSEWQFTFCKALFRISKDLLLCGLNSGLFAVDINKVLTYATSPIVHLGSCNWHNVKPSFEDNVYILHTGKWSMDVTVFSTWYVDETQLKYRFKLAGFDEEWSSLNRLGSIKFNSLPSGNYELEVQAYTPLTGFSAQVSLFKIKVAISYKTIFDRFGSGIKSIFGQFRKEGSLKNEFLIKQNELFKKELEEKEIIQNELTTYKNQLENIITDRTQDLLAEKEKAESADKLKTVFLATMSHEIRTPLGGIIGLNSLLQETNLDPIQEEYVQKIGHSSEHLLQIINNILDITKIESGQLELEHIPFSLNRLVEDICEFSQIKLSNPAIDMVIDQDTDLDLELIGDALRIKQVMFNLIGNSIKFTEKGTIQIKVKQLKSSAGSAIIQFSVADTGIGMTETQMKGLFSAFNQADSSIARKYGGSGLGLNISFNYVKLMGGNLVATSKKDIGTTFSFSLDLLQNEDYINPDEEMIDKLRELRGRKVLLLEDNPISKSILTEYMENIGLVVEVADVIDDAIALSEQLFFDFIFMDWDQRNNNRVEDLKVLQSKTKPMAKYVILSAMDKDVLLKNSTNLHLDEVLLKPISAMTLSRLFVEWIQDDDLIIEDVDLTQIAEILDIDVCVVLGNDLVQLVLNKKLNEIGYNALIFSESAAFVKSIARKNGPFLVFMDKEMIYEDKTLLSTYLRNTYGNFIVLIAVSTTSLSGIENKLQALGFDDYLTFPVNEDKLRSTLLICYQRFRKLKHKKRPFKVKKRSPAGQDNSKFRILVAEDNEVNQLILTQRLEQRGYKVTMTNNGRECVDLLTKDDDFAVIFMDKQMPEMDGMAATEYIRNTLKNDKIIIIALTADVTVETQNEFKEYGLNDYMPKPLNTEVLFKKLDYWIHGKS